MNAPGIADTVGCGNRTRPCPECGSTSTIAHGLCLGCLLRCGLGPDQEPDSLTSVLAEIEVRDTDWCLANYHILEEIGRGGMGVIYRARQIQSRRIVALKRVLAFHSESNETLVRFEREAQAAASLDHPNILPIHEVGRCPNGLPFFSMKFAAGGSLLQAMDAFRDRPRDAIELLAKVARGVHYAHQHQILHRDLKPGNILLGPDGEPYVSDFGLAKWLDTSADLTRTLTIFGTPGYIAPEQARVSRQTLTSAVDVYSLGAILFELLSGRPPFLGEHAIAVIQQAAEKPAPKLRSVANRYSRDLETICERCLERDPSLRYHSAADLAEDLSLWLDDRPIRARRTLPPVRIWRWSRRNRALAISGGIALVLAAAALVKQFQIDRLGRQMEAQVVADHALIVVPFLDLDEIAADSRVTPQITEFLRRDLSRIGPNRVTLHQPGKEWSGSGAPDEIRELARQNSSRAVLSGTVRRVGAQLRIGLHFARGDGADAALTRVISLDPSSADLFNHDFARAIYDFIGGSDISIAAAQNTPDENERIRAFLAAGRDLMNRRTVTDLDRAIICFESAIREDPRSISARSLLAMACMGRQMLSSDPTLAPRALKAAREAVELGPDDPMANRSLAVVCATNGLYAEAQEYALRSLELGDRSGRAFGQIAYSWRNRGRPDKALKWYEKARAAQHHPGDFDALIGDSWCELGRDQEARLAYQSSSTFRPDQPEGWLGLARLNLLEGDKEGAREICRAQLLHYPDAPVAKEFSAVIELFLRNFDEAQRRYLDLLNRDPLGGGNENGYGAVDFRSAIACIKIHFGDTLAARRLLGEVITDAERKLELAPNDARILYRISAAEAMLGRTDDSLKDLKAAIDAGWIDYRSTQLDPRFDNVSSTPEFQTIISGLATAVAWLGRQSPAAPPPAN